MKPYGNQAGEKRGLGGQRSGHPDVRQKSPGPQTSRIDYKGYEPPAPNSGHTRRNIQGGSTDTRTDGGGGMGNDSHANHKKFIGC